jgi:predicted dehydrogenase
VHFRLRSGLVGSLQSTSGDWGSWVVVTRVCGPLSSLWMEGLSDAVFVADRSGTRQLPVPEELRAGPPEPAPPDALHSAYERMIAHGMDVAPYTQLARVFLQQLRGEATPAWARPATFADGVAQMEVLDAIRQSASENGRWIGLEPRCEPVGRRDGPRSNRAAIPET